MSGLYADTTGFESFQGLQVRRGRCMQATPPSQSRELSAEVRFTRRTPELSFGHIHPFLHRASTKAAAVSLAASPIQTIHKGFGRLVVFRLRSLALVVLLLLAMLPAANAQSVTGQISGVVVDPAGATIPGATVQLTHDASQQVRKFTTEPNGA